MSVRIATFNLHDLFDLVNTPGKRDRKSKPTPYRLEVKLQKLTLAIRDELGAPEILAVQEVDNQEILQALGDRINADAGTHYRALSFPTSDERGIEVGFLYDEHRAEVREAYQLYGLDVERAFGRTSPKPGREPVVGIFRTGGMELVLIAVHLKSRGGPPITLPGTSGLEHSADELRREQARAVRAFVDHLLQADSSSLVAVAGDFNDYRYESLAEANHPITILEGVASEPRLVDLVERVPAEERYTFVHHGERHPLDHILVSPALLERVQEVSIPHFNAGYPRALMDEYTSASRSSDHDPVVVRLTAAAG